MSAETQDPLAAAGCGQAVSPARVAGADVDDRVVGDFGCADAAAKVPDRPRDLSASARSGDAEARGGSSLAGRSPAPAVCVGWRIFAGDRGGGDLQRLADSRAGDDWNTGDDGP